MTKATTATVFFNQSISHVCDLRLLGFLKTHLFGGVSPYLNLRLLSRRQRVPSLAIFFLVGKDLRWYPGYKSQLPWDEGSRGSWKTT